MANFDIAYNRTSNFEGGYVNDDADSGKETYNGISRRFNPSWGGWKIVDTYKRKPNFPKNLDSDEALQNLVKSCYKSLYWDKVWGDKIKNQNVANDLYDTAVNMGVGTSIKLSQRQMKLSETGVMNNDLLEKLNLVTG
nr:MAG TPA: Lysozyme [Caudoviricetes sp.]